jgi:hypothetical protein
MSLKMLKMSPADLWHVSLIVAVIGAICIALGPTPRRFLDSLHSTSKKEAARWGIDKAETGSLMVQNSFSDDDLFQLEKRAFFSKVSFEHLRLGQ